MLNVTKQKIVLLRVWISIMFHFYKYDPVGSREIRVKRFQYELLL